MGAEQKALDLLRSIVADIDAMQAKGQRLWFGTFSEWDINVEGVEVSWPNLAILRDEAKKLLSEVGP